MSSGKIENLEPAFYEKLECFPDFERVKIEERSGLVEYFLAKA